jgi:aryl-alcohol dehydrogenase-like predicted oxidoreductase
MQKRAIGDEAARKCPAARLRLHGHHFGYGAASSREEGIASSGGAFDGGVTFSTRPKYGPFTNEEVVGEALGPVRVQVVIATKFGFSSRTARRLDWTAARRTSARSPTPSLKRLRTDRIDLFYQHRVRSEGADRGGRGAVKD